MSGSIQWAQVPDFAQGMIDAQNARQQQQMNSLRFMAGKQEFAGNQALENVLPQLAAQLGSQDPAVRMNALAQIAATGTPGARMAIPMIQTERENSWSYDGGAAPAAAPGPVAAAPPAGGFAATLARQESGGNDAARNPRSTATGRYQFIDGTWLEFARAHPELFRGMSRDQILAARTNPGLQDRALQWYSGVNSTALRNSSLPVNDGTLALAHGFGADGARRLLQANPNTPVSQIFGPDVMSANPNLAGKTAGEVVADFGRRFGGGSSAPAAGGAEAPAARPSGGSPGIDMAMVNRAIQAAARGNQGAIRYLSAVGPFIRQETDKELVQVPDASSPTGMRYVLRSQATNMPAPPRSPEGPFGGSAGALALATIENLSDAVRSGRADAATVRRYASAVAQYQQPTIDNQGNRTVPSLPAYAVGQDDLVRLYPQLAPQAAAAQGVPVPPPGAPPMVTPLQQPATAPGAVPAPPSVVPPPAPDMAGVVPLPSANQPPPPPSAAGGVTQNPAALQPPTRANIEQQQFNATEQLARLQQVEALNRPEFQRFSAPISARWTAIRERAGVGVSPQDTRFLRDFATYRAAAIGNLNQVLRDMSGAAITPQEGERIRAQLPDPGTGMFDGDSPTEFDAKLRQATTALRDALRRHNYVRARGLNPENAPAITDIPRLMNQRGDEIAAALKQANPGISRDQLNQQVRSQLRQEFGQ